MKTKFIARKLAILLLLFMSGTVFAQGGGGLGGGGLGGGLGGLGGGLGGLGGGLGGLGGGTATDTAIVIDSVSQTSLCTSSNALGTSISIIYHTTSTFATGNTFTAQLVSPLGGLGALFGGGTGASAPIDLLPASGGLGGGLTSGGTKTYYAKIPPGTPTGIYNVQLTSSNPAHTSATSSTMIIVIDPTVSISSVCKNDSIFLTATTGGTNAALATIATLLAPTTAISKISGSKIPLQWSTGETDSVIYAGKTDQYSVTFTDTSSGCSAISYSSISNDPIKIDCQMENVMLSSPVDAGSYNWSVDSTSMSTSKSITLKNDVTIKYHLVTSNPISCVSINVDPSICADSNDLYIFVPTIFTPNGDGHNDKLYVRGNNIKELRFSIYDRWGEVVFNTEDPKNGWDGTYKGKEVEPAVLVWYVKTKNYLGAEKEDKGYVTLMR